MDTQDPPTNPALSLLGVYLLSLDNEKDPMTSGCLDSECSVRTGRPVETQDIFF